MKRIIPVLILLCIMLSGCQSSSDTLIYAGEHTSSIVINDTKDVTLVLNNVALFTEETCIQIPNAKSVTVELIGDSTATSKESFLVTNADVTFTGEGTLTADTKDSVIAAEKSVTLETATLNLSSKKNVISCGSFTQKSGNLNITDGNDGIHADSITMEDGVMEITVEDDALHAESSALILYGKVTLNAHEGIEAEEVKIRRGEISIFAEDDGINATGNGVLDITGGYLWINSNGDGIDSNGIIKINGGNITLFSANNADAEAFDYKTDAVIHNGVFAATGSAASRNFSENSEQRAVRFYLDAKKGDIVEIYHNGKMLTFFEAYQDFSCLIVSRPEFTDQSEFSLTLNDQPVEFEIK